MIYYTRKRSATKCFGAQEANKDMLKVIIKLLKKKGFKDERNEMDNSISMVEEQFHQSLV